MLKLSELGSKEQEIAGSIVNAINKVGVEQTILALMKPLAKKKLDTFKSLLKTNEEITFKLYEQVKKTKIPMYLVNINVSSKDVAVTAIPREVELEFEEFTFGTENKGEDSGT